MIVVALAALPVLAAPHIAAAGTTPSETELLVLKKKKAEAARKASAAKKAAALKAAKVQAAKLTAARAKLVVERKVAEAKVRKLEARKGRDCGTFVQCLFGRKKAGVQQASTGKAAVSDYATAEVVSWSPGTKYAPGSLVVQTPERALYLVLGDGKARRYKVGVGREGFQWSGNSKIIGKAEWPTWRPPQVMIEREAAKGHMLPDVMEGGPENPLGARALYIGGTMYRIHGTNNAASIGGAVSSGCIRMMNTDVVDLYDRVNVGAKVYVYQ